MKGFSSHSSAYYLAVTSSLTGSARAAKGRKSRDKANGRNHKGEMILVCCIGVCAGRLQRSPGAAPHAPAPVPGRPRRSSPAVFPQFYN